MYVSRASAATDRCLGDRGRHPPSCSRMPSREAAVASTLLVAGLRGERLIPSYPRPGKKLTRGARLFFGEGEELRNRHPGRTDGSDMRFNSIDPLDGIEGLSTVDRMPRLFLFLFNS